MNLFKKKNILIILYLLLIVIIIYFINQLFFPYESFTKNDDIVLVVSHFNEDLSYLDNEPFNKFKLF